MKLDVATETDGRISVLRLAGTIDEDFGGKALAGSVDADALILDLGGIKKISSFGIREWVDFIGAVKAPTIVLVACAPKVIDQINMVANFTGRGHVLSFQAPFRCDYCDSEHRVLMRVDTDAELIKAKKLPDRPCPSCKQPMYFDDDGATFFSYLATQPAFELDDAIRAKLGGERRVGLKIEKRVDGKVTFLRFSGGLDRGFPRSKIAEGLEGTVICDVTAIDAIDPAGAAEWRAFVRDITPGIELLLIAGASTEFVERLCGKDDLGPKAIVLSLVLPYRCATCDATVRQTIEVGLHHDVLRFATAPSFKHDKCGSTLTCIASEAAMTVLPGLRFPTVNDRAMYLRAKSPPPVLEVVPAKRSLPIGRLLFVFLGFCAIVIGGLYGIMHAADPRRDSPHDEPVSKDPPKVVVVPGWAAATGCHHAAGQIVCVATSFPTGTADDAAADALDAAYDDLANELALAHTDTGWRTAVQSALDVRSSRLLAATTDPSVRRDVRDVRRAVATMLKDALTRSETTPIVDRFDAPASPGVTTTVRVAIDEPNAAAILAEAAKTSDAIGATAAMAPPILAWHYPHLRAGVVVTRADGAAKQIGLSLGDVVLSIDGTPTLDPAQFATALPHATRVQLLSVDGTTRELVKRQTQTGTHAPPEVPTGGINVWDRTSGRNDPSK